MKKQALEDNCKCKECEYRFSCFTQERIFSDPIIQGLYEALIAQGSSKEDALEAVTNEIKARMSVPRPDPQTIPDNPFDNTAPNYVYSPYITISDIDGNISSGDTNVGGITYTDWGDIQVSYTMSTGEVVSWSVGDDDVNELRIHSE